VSKPTGVLSMASILKREFYTGVQFLLMVFVALVVAFFWTLAGHTEGEYAVAINISEAWRNEAPYVNSVLLIFSTLIVVRLAVIFLAHSFKQRIG